MVWLEYNIHIRPEFQVTHPEGVIKILLDLVEPFVETYRSKFNHWHYLVEPDECRGGSPYCEIRVRFEADQEKKLEQIKKDLVDQLRKLSDLTIPEEEDCGSHEGEHGDRDKTYKGSESEDNKFGQDWEKIVEMWQIGSESALKIFHCYTSLESAESRGTYKKIVEISRQRIIIQMHPADLHYPANQLLVEP